MSKSLTLGSFFDGIGGWLLAAKHAGVNPVWASEIDDFPATVSAHHFPQVKQLGDITKINVDELEPTDIICAGSPCQDLSVAGKREGLAGERSGLFVDAIKLVHGLRARTGKPRYFVWENVPGAFSSNKGLDFAAVLSEITESEIPMPKDGRWAESGMVEWGDSQLAWRCLDSQYFGSAQRRKRIFLVADFGGKTAGEILFERKGSAGDSSESQGERKEIATNAGTGVDKTGKGIADNISFYDMTHADEVIRPIDNNKMCTLNARMGTGGNQVPLVFENRHDEGVRFVDGGKTNTLTASMGTGGGNVPLIQTIAIEGNGSRPSHLGNGYKESDKMYTLNATEVHGVGVFPQQSFDEYGEGKPLSTLKAQGGSYGGGSESLVYQKNVGALCMDDYKGANNQYVDQDKCVIQCGVRRLTPLECERLQNLPDGWTDVEYKGKPAPDSKRYKAIGNGMAQVCPNFIIKRIVEVANNKGKTI